MSEVELMCSVTANPCSWDCEWMVGNGCNCANCKAWVERNKVEHTDTCKDCGKQWKRWGTYNATHAFKGHVMCYMGGETNHEIICADCLQKYGKGRSEIP